MIASHFHVLPTVAKAAIPDRLFHVYREYVLRERRRTTVDQSYQAQTALEIGRIRHLIEAVQFGIKYTPEIYTLEQYQLRIGPAEPPPEEKEPTEEELESRIAWSQAYWMGLAGYTPPEEVK